MPNWTYNSLTVEGSKEDISAIKTQLNKPFTRLFKDSWNMETKQYEEKTVTFSNPIFAFWNIVKPTNLEAYNEQSDHSLPMEEQLKFKGDNWYDFNVRNWGTKWDVAVHDGEEYPDTELMEETDTSLAYRFDTAWSPPLPAIEALSAMFPNAEFDLEYEEETGWGGNYIFSDGQGSEVESYDNKCRDCGSLNTLEYCDNDCGEICSECHYMGEADTEIAKECEEHKQYV